MRALPYCAMALFLTACGSSDEVTVYDVDGHSSTHKVKGEDCVDINGDECLNLKEECGKPTSADVYLDGDGAVLQVICYVPIEDRSEMILLSDGAKSMPAEIEKKSEIYLEGNPNEPGYVGDIEIDEDDVTFTGLSPDKAAMHGDLVIVDEGAVISNVTIVGDVIIQEKDVQFSNCVIIGDVEIKDDKATFAGCDIRGEMEVDGKDARLVRNEFSEEPEFKEGGVSCDSNVVIGEDGEADELDCR